MHWIDIPEANRLRIPADHQYARCRLCGGEVEYVGEPPDRHGWRRSPDGEWVCPLCRRPESDAWDSWHPHEP